jgi:hypothetical protein
VSRVYLNADRTYVRAENKGQPGRRPGVVLSESDVRVFVFQEVEDGEAPRGLSGGTLKSSKTIPKTGEVIRRRRRSPSKTRTVEVPISYFSIEQLLHASFRYLHEKRNSADLSLRVNTRRRLAFYRVRSLCSKICPLSVGYGEVRRSCSNRNGPAQETPARCRPVRGANTGQRSASIKLRGERLPFVACSDPADLGLFSAESRG